MKSIANAKGIYATDQSLWSDTQYIRELLQDTGYMPCEQEVLFESWDTLPDTALLLIKHHEKEGLAFWHWVVFKRMNGRSFVLDSAR